MPRRVGIEKDLTLSPWQSLIHDKRLEMNMSYRELGKRAQIPYSTVFNWIHSKDGCPERGAYSSSVNLRLSRVLELEPFTLMKAYDESLVRFTRPRTPEGQNPFANILTGVRRSHKKNWTRDQLIRLLENEAKKSLQNNIK